MTLPGRFGIPRSMPDDALGHTDSVQQAPKAAMSTGRRVVIALAAVFMLFLAWEGLTTVVAYTDDAYVRSDLVAYAPQVTGHVIAVHVRDNQTVRKGDRLISIDPVPFQLDVRAQQAALAAANAQQQADQDTAASARNELAEAVAARDLADENQRRAQSLEADAFASRQALDSANEVQRRTHAAVDAADAGVARAERMISMAQASVQKAQAELATAEWRLARTELYAPVDGSINNLTVEVGDTARADEPIIGIVDANAFRIMANYKQAYVRHFSQGGTAWVWLDSHPWHFYRARIEGVARGISRNVGEDKLLPYVAPTTDWIRLQRRFPVTITLVDPPPGNILLMGADARVVIFP
jgi:membrane fusion protein, multidrug efflux system